MTMIGGVFLVSVCILNLSAGQICVRNTTCVSMATITTCLGATLPFTQTSLEFVTDSATITEVNEKLKLWEGLKYVPECWAVVQPLLCSVYLPKCHNGEVELPSKELCKKIKPSCKIVEIYRGAWPDFLDCDESHFASGCAVSMKAIPNNFMVHVCRYISFYECSFSFKYVIYM